MPELLSLQMMCHLHSVLPVTTDMQWNRESHRSKAIPLSGLVNDLFVLP